MNELILFTDLIDSINTYIKNSISITTEFLYFPTEIPDKYVNKRSLFHLLFNENYEYDNFIYTFSDLNIDNFPSNIINRIYSKGKYIRCMIADETNGYNVLELSDEELVLLNKLLSYKNTFIYPLNNIEYDSLTKNISKLIYLYIDLLGNDRIDIKIKIDKILEFNINSSNIIELLYYNYILDKSHKYILNSNIIIDSSMFESYFFKVKVILDRDHLYETDPIIIEECPKPLEEPSLRSQYLYYKDKIIDEDKYEITFDNGKLFMFLKIPVYKNDVVIFEYMTKDRVKPTKYKKINNVISSYTAIYWR